MKIIVIYKSNTGYTKQYTDMLSNTLNCKAVDLKQINKINLNDYDTIIYGGGVRASRISGFKSVLRRLSPLTGKNIIIFAVGANGLSEENTAVLRDKNLKENNVDYPLFYMQGGFDPDRLNLFLKGMLQSIAKSLKKKEAKDPGSLSAEDRDFLNFFMEKHMDVDEANMTELLNFIESSLPQY